VAAIFRETKERMSLDVVTPELYIINNGYCRVTIDGIPLYRDDDHLSTFGSEYISKAFDRVFDDIAMRIAEDKRLTKAYSERAKSAHR
jgi:hypothetical protein